MTPVHALWLRRIVFLCVGLGIALQVGACFFHIGRGVFRYTTRMVLPPAVVSGSILSYHRVVETAHAFVALGIFSSYQEAFPSALSFVIRDKRLKDMGVGSEHLALAEVSFSSAQEDALRMAHISSREQEKYVHVPLARLRGATVLRDVQRPSQEMRLANIQEKLTMGMPFADVARYFSEDQSAGDGGDLGILAVQTLPEWLAGASTMEVDEIRADFVGADAFWIIKKVDEGTNEELGDWVHLRGIAINKPSVGSLLRAHAQEHKAWIFVW